MKDMRNKSNARNGLSFLSWFSKYKSSSSFFNLTIASSEAILSELLGSLSITIPP